MNHAPSKLVKRSAAPRWAFGGENRALRIFKRYQIGMLILALALFASFGCGAESNPARIDERRSLAIALAREDGVRELQVADGFLRDDLPVRAGDVIESRVLPIIAEQRRALDGLTLTTQAGRVELERAKVLVDARIEALETYRRVLARGLAEDLRFVEASSTHRVTEEGYAAFLEELGGIHQDDDERTPHEDEFP